MPPRLPAADRGVAQPFDLRQVRLLDGPFLKARQRNERYLSSLDLDRQLHVFRLTAGLPTHGRPAGRLGIAQPRRPRRVLRPFALRPGDALRRHRRRPLEAATRLPRRRTGQVPAGPGHQRLSPRRAGERFRSPRSRRQNVEGIYYTVHKLMAGLLDTYVYCGNRQALEIAEKMAGWVDARSRRLSPEHWQRILDVEFGGLNEALYNLYAITHNPRDLEVARRFDHEKIYRPLAEGPRCPDRPARQHHDSQDHRRRPGLRNHRRRAVPQNRRVLLAASRRTSLLRDRRNEQPRTLADRPRQARRRIEQRDAGVLLHLQHAQAHAARLSPGRAIRASPISTSGRCSTASSAR